VSDLRLQIARIPERVVGLVIGIGSSGYPVYSVSHKLIVYLFKMFGIVKIVTLAYLS
jgi:hypothetical protein